MSSLLLNAAGLMGKITGIRGQIIQIDCLFPVVIGLQNTRQEDPVENQIILAVESLSLNPVRMLWMTS